MSELIEITIDGLNKIKNEFSEGSSNITRIEISNRAGSMFLTVERYLHVITEYIKQESIRLIQAVRDHDKNMIES